MSWLQELDDFKPSSEEYLEWRDNLLQIKHQLSLTREQVVPLDLRVRKNLLEKRIAIIKHKLEGIDDPRLLAERMMKNWDYDPTDPLLSYWEDNCHWIYATKTPAERNGMFMLIVRYWKEKKRIIGYLDDKKGYDIIKKGRKLADEGKFRYDDWILAQAVTFYPTCYLKNLSHKNAARITTSWIKAGRYKPALFRI